MTGRTVVRMSDPFAAVREVADAVLYEGYVLYPYRASSGKNHEPLAVRRADAAGYVADDPSERSRCQTEMVFEAEPERALAVRVRFLHAQHRTGGEQPEWDEAVERQVDVHVPVAELSAQAAEWPFAFDAEAARVDDRCATRDARASTGAIAHRGDGTARTVRRAAADGSTSRTAPPARFRGRDDALRSALVAAHTLCALDRGRFLSMTDPPEWAALDVAGCQNDGTWPVLGSSRSVVLSSPIILGDNPQIAPESPGALYDATEIDEILTLRTMALTDAEKAEARATDPRAAAVIDQVDDLAAGRTSIGCTVRCATCGRSPARTPDPTTVRGRCAARTARHVHDAGHAVVGSRVRTASVSPETDAIVIDGVRVARGVQGPAAARARGTPTRRTCSCRPHRDGRGRLLRRGRRAAPRRHAGR